MGKRDFVLFLIFAVVFCGLVLAQNNSNLTDDDFNETVLTNLTDGNITEIIDIGENVTEANQAIGEKIDDAVGQIVDKIGEEDREQEKSFFGEYGYYISIGIVFLILLIVFIFIKKLLYIILLIVLFIASIFIVRFFI
jgi:hypothetical protein